MWLVQKPVHKVSEQINEYREVTEYQVNMQSSTKFLQTSNKHLETKYFK